MRSRWIRACRRLVPASMRDRVFDPTVIDLEIEQARRRAQGAVGRPFRLSFAVAILGVALECRRLRAGGRTARVHSSGRDSMLTTWLVDVRHALRRFVHQPVFALVAVLTLALGIGANVATFSFVNSYLIRPLPVTDPAMLVRVAGRTPERAFDSTSYPNYVDARDGVAGLDLAAHVATPVLFGPEDASESRTLELVSGNYFRVMRLAPVVGRLIDVTDDVAEGSRPVVVLAESLWRARYHADPAVVGQPVRLNGAPYDVIGVVPAGFRGSAGARLVDLWAPVTMHQRLRPRGSSMHERGWGWLQMVGRMAPGVTRPVVQAGLDRVAAEISHQFEGRYGAQTLVVVPAMALPESDRRALQPYLMLTIAFTALLLVVTCANLAGVMQARILARRRELAIRQSLGAGRWRLVSDWMTECVLLALAGGAAGILVARLTVLAIVRVRPPAAIIGDIAIDAPLDWRVMGFAGLTSLVAALLFGLMPAIRAARAQPVALLKEEVATAAGGRRGSRLRQSAVFVQVAVSAVLLMASGLLAMSLRNMQQYDTGFRTDRLALVSVDLKFQRVPPDESPAYARNLLDRARALPGVTAAATVSNVPLTPNRDSYGYRIPGHTPPRGRGSISIDTNVVSAGYFEALGLSFVSGSGWSATSTPHVVVINETMARTFWEGRQAVGQTIEMAGTGLLTIAGVVRDSAYYDIGESPMPFVYAPAEIAQPQTYSLMARTSTPAEDLLPTLEQIVKDTDPRVRPLNATTFEASRAMALYPRRLLAMSSSVFGLLALVLAGVGLYGVVSTGVAQRTREIGVRVALGARRGQIQSGVLRESATLVAAGAVVGLAGGYAVASTLAGWLFGVSPFAWTVYAGVAIALGLVAIIAAWVPARRAASVDPVVALRS